MRSHHLRDLPEALRELFLSSFPTLRASADEVEVLWLEQTDFPRLRKEDLETDHPIVVMSDRSWRISHLSGEDVVDPLEPIAIPARPPVARARTAARGRVGWWVRRTLPISVGLIAFALGLLFPARSSVLDARNADPAPLTRADLEELTRHWVGDSGEDAAVRYLRSDVPGSRPALLRLFQEHNPSPRLRAEAARLLDRR